MKAIKGFGIFGGKGFAVTFANGHTVSVQFGPTNYCEKSDLSIEAYKEPAIAAAKMGLWESKDAEVASWGPDGEWTTKGYFTGHGDDVMGHLTPDEVQAFMAWVASLPAATEAK